MIWKRSIKFSYGTDTSTICAFDSANLKSRLDDIGDWWTIPEDEVKELNAGRLIIAALPTDGTYQVQVLSTPPTESDYDVSAILNVPSGKIFVGDGAHITGEGLEPKDWRYLKGKELKKAPGVYRVSFYLSGSTISVVFEPTNEPVRNDFNSPLELCD